MSYVMTSKDFIDKLNKAALSKTLYVNGAFGAPATKQNKNRYGNNPNFTISRQTKIKNASPNTFFFDCVCLVKGILWGWSADPNAQYGGAKYASNGVPDASIQSITRKCTNNSPDFSTIIPGEFVWNKTFSHCGVYVGNGICVESTSKWSDGVLYSWLQNSPFSYTYKQQSRNWYMHGKLPWIDYKDYVEPILQLDVDGWWGKLTTKRTQQYFKTIQDGIISSQPTSNTKYLPYASTSSWEFVSYAKGSDVIRALQSYLSIPADGYCGQQTVKALQSFLREKGYKYVTTSGTLDKTTVECFQSYLNAQPVTYDWYEK